MITLSTTSKNRLVGVHPDLVRVVKRAAAMAAPEQDFMVVQGLRTQLEMCVNYGKGRTPAECEAKGVPASFSRPDAAKVTWLSNPFASNHGRKKDGFGHAVDLSPFPYNPKEPAENMKALAALVLAAAKTEGVTVKWGGSWTPQDLPHFEYIAAGRA